MSSVTECKSPLKSLDDASFTSLDFNMSKHNPSNTDWFVLCRTIKRSRQLTSFKGQSLSYNQSRGLLEGLNKNASITKIDLKDSYLGDSVELLFRIVATSKTLTELTIRNCAPKSIAQLGSALKENASLKFLCLSENNFGKDIEGREFKGFLAGLPGSVSLMTLDLSLSSLNERNMIDLSNSLSAVKGLQNLNLSSVRMTPAGIKAFGGALKVQATLTHLNLSYCGIGNAADLFEGLLKNTSLKTLVLSGNPLELIPSGGNLEEPEFLSTVLRCNSNLVDLYLAKCGIGNIKPTMAGLCENRTLRTLDLRGNPLENDQMEAIAKTLKTNSSLTKLFIDSPHQSSHYQEIMKGIESNNARLRSIQKPAHVVMTVSRARSTTETAIKTGYEKSGQQAILKRLDANAETEKKILKILSRWEPILEPLEKNAQLLQSMFEKESKEIHTITLQKKIDDHPKLRMYYQYFIRLFTGTWMACQSINSGMVANSEMYSTDYIATGLDAVGARIPVLSTFTDWFKKAATGWNYLEKKKAAQSLAMLYPDLPTAHKEIGALVRDLTLAKESEINALLVKVHNIHALPNIERWWEKFKGGCKDLKTFVLADDAKDCIARLAVEDCEKLLNAIKEGKIERDKEGKIKREQLINAIKPLSAAALCTGFTTAKK